MSNECCSNCGGEAIYDHVYPVGADLVDTWGLSPGLTRIFNDREGLICVHCGVNKRAQGLATAILLSKFGFGQNNLKAWVTQANKNKLKVCELNSCHELHKTLKGLKWLTYAEYGTPTEQNIEELSYDDDSFDLMLHSETLEHVSNPSKAMDECRRVINTDGLILFTTPIIWNRKTRNRASIKDGKIIKLLPASYHGYSTDDYLVFQEYGHDADKILGAKLALNDSLFQNFVFMSTKKPSRINWLQKQGLKWVERTETRKSLGK